MQQREGKRLTSASELAKTMNAHVGTVSCAARRLAKTGQIVIQNSEYVAKNTP